MADKSTDPATVAGIPPPVGLLPIYSTADLANSPEGVKMLAGASALTRSPAGGFQLQIQLQEEKSNSAPPSVTAGSPLRALAQDTVSQDLGHTAPSATTVNALEQRPGSPVGTISSPYIASDAAARLISATSQAYSALAQAQKYTNQSYASYIQQEFALTSSQLQSINQEYDGNREKLLGALAAANMALIGAIVSAGVGIAVSSASMMSPKRQEGDPAMQPEGNLRERAQKPQIADQRPESDASLRSSLTLHPQEVEAHVDPMLRGDRTQRPNDIANAAHAQAAEIGPAARAAPSRIEEDQVLEESSFLRAGDNLAPAPLAEIPNYRDSIRSTDSDLDALESKSQELSQTRWQAENTIREGEGSLNQLRGEQTSNQTSIDRLANEHSEILSQRSGLETQNRSLRQESSKLQQALEALKTDLDPRALEADLSKLSQAKKDLQVEKAKVGEQLNQDNERLANLEQQRPALVKTHTDLVDAGKGLASDKAKEQGSLSELQTAKEAISPKVKALFEQFPDLADVFGKKAPGTRPNHTEINASDADLTSMGRGQMTMTFTNRIAHLHGRDRAVSEYTEWNKGISNFMVNHGAGSKAERTATMKQFNEAWKKGIDLNKLEKDLTIGGKIVSPRELDAQISAGQKRIGEIDSAIASNKLGQSTAFEKLTSNDQQRQIIRFDIESKTARSANLDRDLASHDQQIGRIKTDQEQAQDIARQKDALGDQIAANKANLEISDAGLQQVDAASNAKMNQIGELQSKNDQITQKRADILGYVAHARADSIKVNSELAGLDTQRTSLTQRKGELTQAQQRADEETAARANALQEQSAVAFPAPSEITPESTIPSAVPATAISQADEVAPALPVSAAETASRVAPAATSSVDQRADLLRLEPEQRAGTPGGEPPDQPPTRADSRFNRSLNQLRNLLGDPLVGDVFRGLGTRAGDIITQMGLIYKAQAELQGNVLLQGSEIGQAYIETTKDLLEELLEETADNSKDLDKQMQSLLEVVNSISQTKTEMYRSLFLGQ